MIDNVHQHMISNAVWFILFLLAFIIVTYITHRNNHSQKRNILGYVLFATEMCSFALLVYCYDKLSTSLDNEITKWYLSANVFVNIRDFVTAGIIIIFLLKKLAQKKKGQGDGLREPY